MVMLLLIACTKKNKNDRMFAGNWELESMRIDTYTNNEITSTSDTTFYGLMQLQNGPDVVDGNDAWFTGFQPFPTSFSHWEISNGKARTINFYYWNIDLGINYSYTYNVSKITNRKMELISYLSDDSLNLDQRVTLQFKRK